MKSTYFTFYNILLILLGRVVTEDEGFQEFSAAFHPNRHITNLGINKEKFLTPTQFVKQTLKT